MTPTVQYLAPAGPNRTVAWQRYYLLGLDEVATVRWSGPPVAARLLPGVDRKVRLVYRLDGIRRRTHRAAAEGHVGRYVARLDGETVRFAIDAHDARHVRDEHALRWSDVYFKSNRWAADDYDSKVVPLVNGNGLLDPSRIEHLCRHRHAERDVDIVFISNLYGGRPHVLRLFEELARLPLRMDLLAILDGVDPDDDARYAERLRTAGVPVATSQLPPTALWARLARARLVLIRAGRHACVPWRMLDLLAMGACTVLDATMPAAWPVPLRDGVECSDCGIARPLDGTAAIDEEYAKLGSTLTRLLAEPERMGRIRTAAAQYFDTHAAPGRVGSYILRRCGDRLSCRQAPPRM